MASSNTAAISTPDQFAAVFGVSRETVERLMTYEALLKRWQKTINLVAPSTINHIWHRHFADSTQVWSIGSTIPAPLGHPLAPSSPRGEAEVRHWLDLGSGAGFPGLVIAVLAAEKGGTRHTLVESDSRKVAFLRQVARELGVAVDILCTRIENPETRARVGEIHCVTARALAPLARLAQWVAPYFGPQTIGIFPKGREVTSEIEDVASGWDFDFELFPSVTDGDARVVLLKSLKPKA